MKQKTLAVIAVACLSCTLTTGFGLKDVVKEIKPDTDKCQNDKDCERKEKLKSAAKVVAVGVAAKLLYDLAIDYRSRQVEKEDSVIEGYKKDHKGLPDQPELLSYTSSLKPGQVVKPNEPVKVVSKVVVVPGKNTSQVLVQERISIHDNEDPEKVIKSLVKSVNEPSKNGGAFENEFSFVLPEGMPQGVYPVRTAVLINDKEVDTQNNDMQVVLEVTPAGSFLVSRMY